MRGIAAARRRFDPSSALVFAAFFSSAPAHALDDAVSLAWNAPVDAGCADSGALLEEIRALIGAAPSGSRPSIQATANVTRIAPDRFHLELTTRLDAALGHRSLDARSCPALGDATALILAWMIDPNAMATRSEGPAPRSEPASPVPVIQPRPPAPIVPTSRDTGEISAALDFVLDAGTLPRPGMGVGGHLTYRFLRFFRVDARSSYWPRSPATSADPSVGGVFSLLAAGASLCGGPHFAIALCVGPEVDWMRGESLGARNNGEGSDAWISLDVDGVVRIPIVKHLRLVGIASWLVPTKRQFFELEGVGIVHRPSVMAGRGALGLEMLF